MGVSDGIHPREGDENAALVVGRCPLPLRLGSQEDALIGSAAIIRTGDGCMEVALVTRATCYAKYLYKDNRGHGSARASNSPVNLVSDPSILRSNCYPCEVL